MTIRKHLFSLTLIFSILSNLSQAAIHVQDAWCRPSLKMVKNGAVFMTLAADTPTALIKAESSVAQTVELHTHIQEGEIMRMRKVEKFDIDPHQETILEPGRDHIMLIDLKKTLKAGQSIDLKLTFSDGSTQILKVPVRSGIQKSTCGCHH